MAKEKVDSSTQKQLDISRAYKRFFESDDGVIVLRDLMRAGRFLSNTVDPLPHITSRNEGQRELVGYIIEKINESPERILDFIKQSQESGEENPL